MTKLKPMALAISLALSLLFFLLLRIVVYGSAYGSLAMMLGLSTMENLPLVESAMLITTGILCVNIYQLLSGKISLKFLKVETTLYFFVLLAVVMFKSLGVQEINLDITDIYSQVIEYPASVVINILLFVPLGAIAFKYSKSTLKASIFALTLIFTLEVLQYLLHLGIADVVDVFVDLFGFLIGYLAVSVIHELGFKIVPKDDCHIKVAYGPVDTPEKKPQLNSKSKMKIGSTVLFFAITSAVFTVGFWNSNSLRNG